MELIMYSVVHVIYLSRADFLSRAIRDWQLITRSSRCRRRFLIILFYFYLTPTKTYIWNKWIIIYTI